MKIFCGLGLAGGGVFERNAVVLFTLAFAKVVGRQSSFSFAKVVAEGCGYRAQRADA